MSNVKSPEEVLEILSEDVKRKRLNAYQIESLLGYKNRQSLYNLFSSKKYLSPYQARKFHDAFNCNEEFLTSGKGQLYSDEEINARNERLEILTNALMKRHDEVLSLIMSWFHDILEHYDDGCAMDIWSDILTFTHARTIIRPGKLDGQVGRPMSKEEWDEKVKTFQDSLSEEIEQKINKLLLSDNHTHWRLGE